MKKIILILIATTSCFIGYCKDGDNEFQEQFDDVFKTTQDKSNISRLRDFLERKDAEYKNIQEEIQKLSSNENLRLSDSTGYRDNLATLTTFLNSNQKHGRYYYENEMNPDLTGIMTRYETRDLSMAANTHDATTSLANLTDIVNKLEDEIKKNNQLLQRYRASLTAINNDRQSALRAMQQFYDVEKGNQGFKTEMSAMFALIIILLLGLFFWFLYKKSDQNIGVLFLSGNGLQFITLFAIIISTILFGILNILEGKELAAILSGIAGFILGKGITPEKPK